MSRAVSTWVIAIITVCFAFMQFGSLKLIFDDPFNMFDGSASSMVSFDRLDGVSAVSTFLQNSNVLIILAVFVVLFANAEHKCGFDKNLIGITNHKWKHALARWISAVIGMTCFLAIGFVVLLDDDVAFLVSLVEGAPEVWERSIHDIGKDKRVSIDFRNICVCLFFDAVVFS